MTSPNKVTGHESSTRAYRIDTSGYTNISITGDMIGNYNRLSVKYLTGESLYNWGTGGSFGLTTKLFQKAEDNRYVNFSSELYTSDTAGPNAYYTPDVYIFLQTGRSTPFSVTVTLS